LSCGLAIAAGTFVGGWRVIRTLGKGPGRDRARRRAWPPSRPRPRSSCCPATSVTPLSTTHVATGSIIGTGPGQEGRRGALETWPAGWRPALGVSRFSRGRPRRRGRLRAWRTRSAETAGVVVDTIILIAISGTIYWRSRQTKVDHSNVNSEWTRVGRSVRARRHGRPGRGPDETGESNACITYWRLRRPTTNSRPGSNFSRASGRSSSWRCWRGAGLPALFRDRPAGTRPDRRQHPDDPQKAPPAKLYAGNTRRPDRRRGVLPDRAGARSAWGIWAIWYAGHPALAGHDTERPDQMAMTEVLKSIIGWLRAGYPEGRAPSTTTSRCSPCSAAI